MLVILDTKEEFLELIREKELEFDLYYFKLNKEDTNNSNFIYQLCERDIDVLKDEHIYGVLYFTIKLGDFIKFGFTNFPTYEDIKIFIEKGGELEFEVRWV